MHIAIIIPSRLSSTRLDRKPLLPIASIPLLERVIHRAKEASNSFSNISIVVACDSEDVANIAHSMNIETIMTASDIKTGTDRVFAAARLLKKRPDYVINLQGDAPFMPLEAISELISHAKTTSSPFATVLSQLPWSDVDKLREHKISSPSSGTTAIIVNNKAVWFSKNILPHMRHETILRQQPLSPVYRHFGIYGYTFDFLEKFVNMPTGYYENIESLEQLRAIEHGHPPDAIILKNVSPESYQSIDTPYDLKAAEHILKDST